MPILVTGATGNVGRLVVDHLIAAGASVRALTKNPEKAALPTNVEVVQGFIGEPDTLDGVFDDVEVMYLAPLPETAVEVVALARKAGVRRIVALSQYDAEVEAAGEESDWHYYAVEKAVEDSGLEWTFLRPGGFFINALGWVEPIQESGVVRAPYGDATQAHIDLDDIAQVAAVALLNDGHVGQKYLLTGPQSLKKSEMVRIIGEVIGKDVRFDEQTREEAYQEMFDGGWGESADWMLDVDAQSIANPQPVSPLVEQLTGQRGTTFAQWVAKNADSFR